MAGGVSENFDERLADDFAFALRLGHPFEPAEKERRGVAVFEMDFEMPGENFAHDFRLARAQQPIVDKDARQLFADRLVQQTPPTRSNPLRRSGPG